jgi:hypothetical protein
MSLIVKNGDFETHPEGQFRAVCVDVVDLGMVENKTFGKMQHKIAVVFHTEARMRDGRPFEHWERFTATLSEKGALRKFLVGWRGRAFTDAELAGFDLEKLIGVNAVVQITHNRSGDKTFANTSSIMLPMKGMEKLALTDGYIRRKDRQPEMSKTPEPAMAGAGYDGDPGPDESGYDDDDLPF